ncbi:MAG TPA: hypothetical protein VJ851_11250 [Jatrophihabitans sp.]|nr:hypothetical protein [Jatrophihabitans sp.]
MAARPQWGEARVLATCTVIAAFGVIARTEIAAIIAQIPVEGRVYSPAPLASLLHLSSPGTAFSAWAQVPCPPVGVPVRHWLRLFCLFDLVWTLGYGLLLHAGNRRWSLRIGIPTVALVVVSLAADGCRWWATRWLPHAGGASSCTTSTFGSSAPDFILIAGLTIAKWVAFGLILIVAVYQVFLSQAGKGRAAERGDVLHALVLQRLPLLVVGALSALLLLHGSAILEQGVDVERTWFLTSDDGRGWQSAGFALLGFILLAFALRYTASMTAGSVGHTGGRKGTPPALRTYLPWLIAAAFFGLAALVSTWTGRAQLRGWTVTVTVLVLVLVPIVSLALSGVPSPVLARHDELAVRVRTWKVGRLLAYGPLVVLLLSMARAYVPPMVLNYRYQAENWALILGPGVLAVLLVYVVLSFGRHPAVVDEQLRVARRLAGLHPQLVGSPEHGTAEKREDEVIRQAKPARQVLIAFLIPAIAVCASFVALVMLERQTADVVGVVGIIALCFCGLTAFYALLVATANISADPPYVFRLMRMRRTPVVALVLIIGLVSGITSTGSPLHNARVAVAGTEIEVRTSSDGTQVLSVGSVPVGTRPTLLTAFTSWDQTWDQADAALPTVGLAQAQQSVDRTVADQGDAKVKSSADPPGCGSIIVTYDGMTARIRPMLFVAGEGGGMRAEAWTVNAMGRLLSSAHGCGRQSVFVVSAVSGSAIGLTLLDTMAAPMKALAGSTGEAALANGISGLLTHDLIAGVFGVNVRPIAGQPGEPAGSSGGSAGRFPDRAALMEQAWERDAVDHEVKAGTGLGKPFPIASTEQPPPWRSVFNATSVGYRCRSLVSDIDFGPHATTCTDPANPMPGAYDLFGAQPCYLGLPTSTAGLLAARFPYLTPSGVIRDCGKDAEPSNRFSDQLIDGGYSENTGIQTVNDMLGQLMPAIRAANARSVALHPQRTINAEVRATDDLGRVPLSSLPILVVPLVLFLHNTTAGSLPDQRSSKAVAEWSLPITSAMRGGGVLSANSTLLQRATALTTQVLPDGESTGDPAADAGELAGLEGLVAKTFSARAMTLGPQFAPQVGLPLGWVLSQETEDSMRDALNSYLQCPSVTQSGFDPCKPTVPFNSLAELLGVPHCWAGADQGGNVRPCSTKQG